MNDRRPDWLGGVLAGLSCTAVFIALMMVFFYAPREATMGDVQRIFYFHVASAWVGFFAFFVTFVAGIGYLGRGERRWDILALSSVEVGLTFITMTVATGALWARPAWGTFWTWEPRLTISAVQLLIYVSYLMLRAAIDSPERKARFAAVYGIVAFISVPINFVAIRMWRTQHPLMFGGEQGGLGSNMMFAFFFSLITFTVWYVTLMWHRIRLERFRDNVEQLKQRIME